MFKSNTVFVVGAGASKELELPLGDELTLSAARALSVMVEIASTNRAPDARMLIFDQALQILEGEGRPGLREDLLKEAPRVQQAMPLISSVDSYLDTHRQDPLKVQCGKLAIAWAIAEEESTSLIRKPSYFSDKLRAVWHRSFLNELIRNVLQADLRDLFDPITFIIFNYDRCVEHYLHSALNVIYPDIPEVVAEALNRATFIHPYGVIGRLPWQTGASQMVKFGGISGGLEFVAAAGNLLTYTEGVTDQNLTTTIAKAIRNARRIVFLGFSFQSQNMELMKIDGPGVRPLSVLGTAFAASESDTEVFRDRIRDAFRLPIEHSIELRDLTCARLFREYSQTISA